MQRAIELSETKYCSVEATLRPGGADPRATCIETLIGRIRTTRTVFTGERPGLYYRRRTTPEEEVRGPRSRAVGRPGRRHPLPHLPLRSPSGRRRRHGRRRRRAVRPPPQRGPHAPGQARAGGLSGHRLPPQHAAAAGRPSCTGSATWSSPSASRRAATSCSRAWRSSALAAGGTRDDALRVCREAGAAEGRRALAGDASAPRDRRGGGRARAPHRRGAGPAARGRLARRRARSIVNNCTFRELSGADPDLVCAMHRAFLEGVLEVVTAGPRAPAHRPRRLPHQLRRRALRAALHVLAGDE